MRSIIRSVPTSGFGCTKLWIFSIKAPPPRRTTRRLCTYLIDITRGPQKDALGCGAISTLLREYQTRSNVPTHTQKLPRTSRAYPTHPSPPHGTIFCSTAPSVRYFRSDERKNSFTPRTKVNLYLPQYVSSRHHRGNISVTRTWQPSLISKPAASPRSPAKRSTMGPRPFPYSSPPVQVDARLLGLSRRHLRVGSPEAL